MILSASGLPQPPADVVKRLRELSPDLGMRFCPLPSGSVWGITQEWGPEDKRRQMILKGEMDPDSAHDIIAWVPVRVPNESIPGWVAKQWRRVPDREDLRKLLDKMSAEELQETKEASRPALEEAFNQVEVMGSKLFKDIIAPVPKVLNAGIPSAPAAEVAPSTPKRKKGK